MAIPKFTLYLGLNDKDSKQQEIDTTMKKETNTPVQEYTHAANCLYIYLMNTAEIYQCYTVPAIESTVHKIKLCHKFKACDAETMRVAALISTWRGLYTAIDIAARLVQRYDRLTPTFQDIAAVKANYVDYIIECAQYKVNNA